MPVKKNAWKVHGQVPKVFSPGSFCINVLKRMRNPNTTTVEQRDVLTSLKELRIWDMDYTKGEKL